MTAKFIDSNLWIYLYSTTPEQIAVAKLIEEDYDNIILSTQVLSEVYSTLSKKMLQSTTKSFLIIKKLIENFNIYNIESLTIIHAIELQQKYHFSYWDSLIVASALNAGCKTLFTEDLQHNQLIEKQLRVLNPFLV